MQVRYDEGVANRIDPEPCVACPRGQGRSVGRGAHRPAIEPRKVHFRAPTLWTLRKATRCEARYRERPSGPAWSQTLACAEALCTGTGRSRVWPGGVAPAGPHREGEEP